MTITKKAIKKFTDTYFETGEITDDEIIKAHPKLREAIEHQKLYIHHRKLYREHESKYLNIADSVCDVLQK